MKISELIFAGIKGRVVALNRGNGQIVWSTALAGMEFVNTVLQGNLLFATAKGEIFCLDPITGDILWANPLKGYGLGLVTLAGVGISQTNTPASAQHITTAEQQGAVSAASTSATST